jgi:hypothetical protein
MTPLRVDPPITDESPGEEMNLSLPWALELTNGERCVFIQGTGGLVDGMRLNYKCGTGWVVGELDQGKEVWRANYYRERILEISQVDVRRIWA